MAYKIQSSEKTKAKGSEFETKALLYLMNFRNDSKEIHYFVIDFFNDITGIDRYSTKTWDLQSKAKKDNYQSDIGKELITLFKNYISCLNFNFYILFLGGVVETIRNDKNKNIFKFKDITSDSQNKIRSALLTECKNKTYIDITQVTNSNINKFLKEVIFVVDDKEKHEYIESIIKVNPLIIPDKVVLEQIFNQIRDVQSSKKNNNNVEGIIINAKEDFIYHNRHLTSHEIRMMVLNRIINYDLMQKGITPSFISIYNKIPLTEQQYMVEDCKLNIAKTLFDKNNSENFWDLFSNIYNVINSCNNLDIDLAYKRLDYKILKKLSFLDMMSVKYFMAIIKDGMYEN